MRLGSWPCRLDEKSFAYRAYGPRKFRNAIVTATSSIASTRSGLKAAGLRITGQTPDGTYVEICELADHPWFLGCQFHPEFKSKPMEPHPLFKAFIGASYENRRRRLAPLVADPQAETRTEVSYSRGD